MTTAITRWFDQRLIAIADWCATPRWLVAARLLRQGFALSVLIQWLLLYHSRHFVWGPDAFEPREPFLGTGNGSLFALPLDPLAFEVLFHASLGIALLTLLGWRPRIMVPLLWVVAWSLFQRNTHVLDGGDNLLQLCLLFLVLARTAGPGAYAALPRHVSPASVGTVGDRLARVLHTLAMMAIVVQVCIVYLGAGLAKVAGEPWQQGTAVYYILRTNEFTWPLVAPLIWGSPLLSTMLTYLTVVDQVAYPFLLLHRIAKRIAIGMTILMHIGIALIMGLFTFSLTMITVQAVMISDAEFGRLRRRWLRALARMRLAVRRPLAVEAFYDAWCPACRRVRQRVGALDALRVIHWRSSRDWRSAERCGVDIEQLNREMHVRSARGTVSVGMPALAAIACRVPVLMPIAPVLMLLGHTAFGARFYRRIAYQRSAIPVGNPACGTEGCTFPTVRPSAPS